MFVQRSLNRCLTRRLARAVHTRWGDLVFFAISRPGFARKHVIGRDMQQWDGGLPGGLCQGRRAIAVDRISALTVRLCVVDVRVGSGIDDHTRIELADDAGHLISVCDIQTLTCHAKRLETIRTGTVYQLVADLATGSAYKDSHLVMPHSKLTGDGEHGFVQQIRCSTTRYNSRDSAVRASLRPA